jgi:hypothetical protein
MAYIPESPEDEPEAAATVADGVASRYQPDSYVYINRRQYRLATIPTNGSQILVDVTQPAGGKPVAVGDRVCILCVEHPLGALGQVRKLDVSDSGLLCTTQ